MKAYAYEHTMKENGILTLKKLPFNIGEKIEVIIIPRSKFKGFRKVPFDSALAFAISLPKFSEIPVFQGPNKHIKMV